MKLFITFILSALMVFSARPATYYIDFDSGSDSNTGTSEGAPWKRTKGDAAATGNAAAATYTAGDTIKFKRGVVYSNEIVLNFSGGVGNPITYEASTTWGSGSYAIIDLNYLEDGNGFELSANVSNIVFRAFHIRNIGGYADDDPILLTDCATNPITTTPGGVGIRMNNGGNRDIYLDGLYLERIGNWRNTSPFSGVNSVSGVGIAVENTSNVTITNCELTKMRIGLSLKSSSMLSNTVVDNCDIHDYVVWGMDIAPRAAGAWFADLNIRNTRIYDYHQHDSGNWEGCGEKPHTDGIFIRTTGVASGWTNINIYNCDFWADNPGASAGGTASIYISQGPAVNIWNCTFRADKHTRSIGIGHSQPAMLNGQQVVRIMNNVFHLTGGTSIVCAGETNPLERAIFIENNIFWRDGSSPNNVHINWDSGVKPMADYNLHYSSVYDILTKNVYFSGAYRKFAALPANGYETNGIWGDPLFVDVTSTVPSERNLRVLAGSPALGAGKDLSAYFTTDRDGTTITDWHIGAFTAEGALPDLEMATATVDSTGTNWTFQLNRTSFVGSGGDGGFSASLTLGAITFTYAGGSGTDTLSYTGNRVTYSGETGSLSYTQPGNGIEDSDGDDLATFSGLTVVNNSSQQQPAPSGASGRAIRLKGIKARP